MMFRSPLFLRIAMILLSMAPAAAAQTPPLLPDVPAKYDAPSAADDYVRREVMIPMRDGVKLFTVIVVPKGAAHAPILFTRTPYNAAGRARRSSSTRMLGTLPQGDELFVLDGRPGPILSLHWHAPGSGAGPLDGWANRAAPDRAIETGALQKFGKKPVLRDLPQRCNRTRTRAMKLAF